MADVHIIAAGDEGKRVGNTIFLDGHYREESLYQGNGTEPLIRKQIQAFTMGLPHCAPETLLIRFLAYAVVA